MYVHRIRVFFFSFARIVCLDNALDLAESSSSDRHRLADCVYAAFSLEETIYQLAKVNLLVLTHFIIWAEWTKNCDVDFK